MEGEALKAEGQGAGTDPGSAGGGAGEGAQHDATGRAAVRLHFIDRLALSGLKPPRGMTEAQHREVQRHLVDHLAYLSVPSLVALADQVLDAAGGAKRDVWPSELVVRQMAEALERRPFEQAPIITSWLASVEGPKAQAGGYLVQLYRHLRRHRRPILPFDLVEIRAEAERDASRERMLIERAHLAQDHDRQWLVAMAEDRRRAEEIVDRGQRARDVKARGEAA